MTLVSSGVEIEGGWNELPLVFFNEHAHVFRTDGSVHELNELECSNCSENKRRCKCTGGGIFEAPDNETNTYAYVGEIASHPFNKINNLLNFVDKYYAIKTNKHCGLHLHVKTENVLQNNVLQTRKFYKAFCNAMKTFGKSRNIDKKSEFWKRLNGHNTEYCKRQFVSKNKMTSDRYNLINFNSIRKHGTIEFRLLPAFQSKSLAIDALRFIFDFTNTYLDANHKIIKCKIKKRIIL